MDFKSEEEPTSVENTGSLKVAIRKNTKRRTDTPPEVMKALRDEWLKDNEPTIVEPEQTKYEPYAGIERNTRNLTRYGEFSNSSGGSSEDSTTRDIGT